MSPAQSNDRIARSSDPKAYNEMYRSDDRTYDHPERSPYLPVFRSVVDEVRRCGIASVLEVGCGSGTLAQMLISAGVDYRGFDFAEEGVRKARVRCPKNEFYVADARAPSSYTVPYDGIVCVEVLEHVLQDRKVIRQWRPSAHCVCTVPNFDFETHVRKFMTEGEVLARYSDLIDIEKIARIKRPIWAGGLTFAGYLGRLRFNLSRPRYVAGLLGINSFDNHAGWFLFSGRRKPSVE